jgi:hypothetical protein
MAAASTACRRNGRARERDALSNRRRCTRSLQRFESGQAYIEMGQRLLALQASHEALLGANRQVQEVERQLKESREESRRLLVERDAALAERRPWSTCCRRSIRPSATRPAAMTVPAAARP